jgi:hypothetical protein
MDEKPIMLDEVKGDLRDNQVGDVVADLEVKEATDDSTIDETDLVSGSGYGGALLPAGERRSAIRNRTHRASLIGSKMIRSRAPSIGTLTTNNTAIDSPVSGTGFHPKVRGNRMPEGRGITGSGVLTTGSGVLTDNSREPASLRKMMKPIGKLSKRQSGYGVGMAGAGIGMAGVGSQELPADVLRKKIIKQLKRQKRARR